MNLKVYFICIIYISLFVGIFGFLSPTLISMKNTIANISGFLILLVIPAISPFFFKLVKKAIK